MVRDGRGTKGGFMENGCKARAGCVQVLYAGRQRQWQLQVPILEGDVTVVQVIQASGLLTVYPWWQLDKLALGVFAQAVELNSRVSAGDRVEIYAPLQIDPMRSRQLRAAAKSRRAAIARSKT